MIETKDKHDKYLEEYRNYFSSLLYSISDHHWDSYKSSIEIQYFKKGELFLRPGDNANRYGFVVKGLFKQYFSTSEGKHYITSFISEKRIASDFISLIKDIPARSTIKAITDSAVLVVPKKSKIIKNLVSDSIEQGIQGVFAEINYIEKESREREFLSLTAAKRYRKFCSEKAELIENLSQSDIASYLGINYTSLSRIRGKK